MATDVQITAAIKKTLRAEQAAVRELASITDGTMVRAVRTLAESESGIFVTGLGKSSYVAMKMAASLASFGVRAQYLNAVEAMHGDSGVVGEGSVLVAFSYSGETAEVVRAARHVKQRMRASVIAVTGKPRSSLAKLADHHLTLTVKEEGSPENIAPMASVTASLVVADLLTAGLLSLTAFDPHRFASYHPGGSLGLKLRPVESVMQTGKEIPLSTAEKTLKDALSVMMTRHGEITGIVGIVDAKGKLAGVVTDGDIRRALVKGQATESVRVSTLMSKRPKCVRATDSLADALAIMEQHKITALFVVDRAKKPVGIVHIHHILEQV